MVHPCVALLILGGTSATTIAITTRMFWWSACWSISTLSITSTRFSPYPESMPHSSGPTICRRRWDCPVRSDHPDVLDAQQRLLAACKRHGVPAGIHVVPVDGDQVSRKIDEGFRFIACGIDTEFLLFAARHMLQEIEKS